MTNKIIFTAFEFSREPGKVFQASADGNAVIINHAQFKSGVFELTYRPRAGFSEQPEPISAHEGKVGTKDESDYRTAIVQVKPEPEWQPMETVPKDGTVVMCRFVFKRYPDSFVACFYAKYDAPHIQGEYMITNKPLIKFPGEDKLQPMAHEFSHAHSWRHLTEEERAECQSK